MPGRGKDRSCSFICAQCAGNCSPKTYLPITLHFSITRYGSIKGQLQWSSMPLLAKSKVPTTVLVEQLCITYSMSHISSDETSSQSYSRCHSRVDQHAQDSSNGRENERLIQGATKRLYLHHLYEDPKLQKFLCVASTVKQKMIIFAIWIPTLKPYVHQMND